MAKVKILLPNFFPCYRTSCSVETKGHIGPYFLQGHSIGMYRCVSALSPWDRNLCDLITILRMIKNPTKVYRYQVSQICRSWAFKIFFLNNKLVISMVISKVTFFHQFSKMQIIPINKLTFKLVFSNFFGFSDYHIHT